MNTKLFLGLCLLIFTVACNSENRSVTESISGIEDNLKTYMFSKHDDFQITKIYSKHEDKTLFLKAGLGEKLVAKATKVESQEFYFKALSQSSESHIGAAILSFPDDSQASDVINSIEKEGYLENSKILTRYIARNLGDRILVVYTESAADEETLNLLVKLSNAFSIK